MKNDPKIDQLFFRNMHQTGVSIMVCKKLRSGDDFSKPFQKWGFQNWFQIYSFSKNIFDASSFIFLKKAGIWNQFWKPHFCNILKYFYFSHCKMKIYRWIFLCFYLRKNIWLYLWNRKMALKSINYFSETWIHTGFPLWCVKNYDPGMISRVSKLMWINIYSNNHIRL